MGINLYPLPQNQGKLFLPLLGGNFLGNLAVFYQKILPLKTVQLLPFFLIIVNYPIFSLNYQILRFQKIVQYFLLPKKNNNLSKTGNILQFWE